MTLHIFIVCFLVMQIFVRQTMSILICVRHAHLCTNNSQYSYGFLSCTSLYKWLSLLLLYGFSSCTSLYVWIYIFLCVFVMHIFVRMTIHILFIRFFFTHIFVRMTIPIIMGSRHAHLCTNDYPYCFCIGIRHAHICTNDYPYLYRFSSCTSLYE